MQVTLHNPLPTMVLMRDMKPGDVGIIDDTMYNGTVVLAVGLAVDRRPLCVLGLNRSSNGVFKYWDWANEGPTLRVRLLPKGTKMEVVV
jgi:hypothetical protein